MTILHKTKMRRINKAGEIEILIAATSLNMLNDVINGRNDPLYKYYSQLTAGFQLDIKPNQRQKIFDNRSDPLTMF